MMIRTSLVLVLLSVAPAYAQFSQTYENCSKSTKTQLEINDCTAAELKRQLAVLEDKYSQLSKIIRDDKLATQKLKALQASWTSYRNAYMDAMYPAENKQAEYGTMYPASAALSQARLTIMQIDAVNAILDLYKPR